MRSAAVILVSVASLFVAAPDAAAQDSTPITAALDTSARFLKEYIRDQPALDLAASPSSSRVVWSIERPSHFPALATTYQVLSGLDWFTTMRALGNGNAEANPTVAPIASASGAFLVTKSASAALSIYMAERLWKRNRTAAVASMVVLNVVMSGAVVNNYAVARRH